jgi:hypothetical protein
MRPLKLFAQLNGYYLAVTLLAYLLVIVYPDADAYMPLGGAQKLLSGSGGDTLAPFEIHATQIRGLSDSIFWLVFAMLGALLTVIPVSRTYIEIRSRDEYDQSLVETIVILPIAVTGVVVIVHNSLALAFSLAGVVGAVRFRNTLKSSGDAIYILLAIGIGLAAGIGALEIAIVMSIVFNYCFLGLWVLDYGARKNTHRYMRHTSDKKTRINKDHPTEKETDGEPENNEVV